jgi:hypothetical protein
MHVAIYVCTEQANKSKFHTEDREDYDCLSSQRQIGMAMQCKASVCSLFIVGITGSNPAEGTGHRLVCLLCVV